MQLAHAPVGIVLLSLIGCESASNVPDLFEPSEYRKPFRVRLQSEANAPMIVLGRVGRARPIGAPKHSLRDPRVVVQLTKITLRVEQVLKGTVGTDQLDFYYYTFSRENGRDLGIPRYLPVIGERRIYFLQAFQKGYRSVGDVADYTLPVESGYHDQDFCRGKSVGCCVAEILLVPGQGYDSEAFSRQIAVAQYAASVLCSRAVALKLVQQLQQHLDERISRAAGEILADARANGEL